MSKPLFANYLAKWSQVHIVAHEQERCAREEYAIDNMNWQSARIETLEHEIEIAHQHLEINGVPRSPTHSVGYGINVLAQRFNRKYISTDHRGRPMTYWGGKPDEVRKVLRTELRDLAKSVRERCSGDGKAAMLVAGRYADILEDAALKLESKSNYQTEVTDWATQCFGQQDTYDTTMRSHRFLEEAVELVQACGITRIEVLQIVHYVYSRPAGVMKQEVGGVLVTLAVLCSAFSIDMQEAGNTELLRIWMDFEKIRAKHKAKPKFSSEGD